MNDIQHYLQDFLTIDCEIQANLQQLLVVKSREALESKSGEIKRSLKEFKAKLNEMKDFCESFNTSESRYGSNIISRFLTGNSTSESSSAAEAAAAAAAAAANSGSTSPRDLFINEYSIHKEQLTTVETRYRNAYLAAQNKLDMLERNDLFSRADAADGLSTTDLKKRTLNGQILLKQNSEMTGKLSDISRQLKWIDSQAGEIIPVLDESSKGIKNVQQEFGTMRVVINDGKRLLTRLGRREFTDKLLIALCLCFFFSVVFYIIWKRIL
jgi:hypothetical protein